MRTQELIIRAIILMETFRDILENNPEVKDYFEEKHKAHHE